MNSSGESPWLHLSSTMTKGEEMKTLKMFLSISVYFANTNLLQRKVVQKLILTLQKLHMTLHVAPF